MADQPTEEQVDALCDKACDVSGAAVGEACRGFDAFYAHIALVSVGTSSFTMAAKLLLRDTFGEMPADDDHRLVELIRGWGMALLLFPDQKAVAQKMTDIRERVLEPSFQGLNILGELIRERDDNGH